MPELWAGRLRGEMYRERIKIRELAEEADLSYTYVVDILAGRRIVPDGRERLEEAHQRILERMTAKKKKRVHGSDEHASAEQSALEKPNYSM